MLPRIVAPKARLVLASTSFPASFSNTAVSNPTVNASDNRFTSGQGYTYDAAGNVLTDAEGRSFTYDAENKQKEVKNASNQTIGLYYFDGDGRRVKKVSATETVIFVFDAGGKLVAEYSTNPSQTPQVQYLTNDHPGTPRINTNENGAVVSRTDYMPYGEEIIGLGGRSTSDKYVTDDVRQGFTGYINDEETGLDYAQARMYKKELGRFTGADPLLASGRTSQPGSWNRYAYCWNNPLMLVDPAGKDVQMLDEKARSRLLSTLPDSIRKQVEKQIKKDGTLKRGSLDKIKSDDPNFLDLKQIVDNKATLEIMTATADPRKGGGDFDYETKEEKRSIIIARELELGSSQEEAEEAANESLNNPDAVQNISLGVTLPPNSDGNPSKNYRVILADGTGKTADAPESELAARSAHEIYGHGLPAIKGEPWKHEYKQPIGPIDSRVLEIEKRTRDLYKKP